MEGGCNVQKTAFLGLPQVRKCSGQKKTFHGWGKIREFYFESWKISLVREMSFISEKSCGFEKDENGNHVCAVHYCLQGVNTSVITQFPCGRAYFLYEMVLDAPQKI